MWHKYSLILEIKSLRICLNFISFDLLSFDECHEENVTFQKVLMQKEW